MAEQMTAEKTTYWEHGNETKPSKWQMFSTYNAANNQYFYTVI